MLKNASYKEKFTLLKPWFSMLIEEIKKDLKNDHLKNDLIFCKRYLPGKNTSKATSMELAEAYSKAIEDYERAEDVAEYLSQRWLLKNSELYDFFEAALNNIDPNFTELEMLDLERSKQLMETSVKSHGALRTYFFSVINSVVFPKEIYDELSQKATTETDQKKAEALIMEENLSLENMRTHYEQQMARLTDKYEKKLSGLQKKYVQDTGNLKKQLAQLQKKMG